MIVSACLVGVNCKYNSRNNLDKNVLKYLSGRNFIPVCPEQLGGCPTPRPPVEICDGTGAQVLDGKCKVKRKDGEDVTDCFITGAQEVLKIVKIMNVKQAILKARSPSCGFGNIYDGTFSGKIKNGNGVTAELLKNYGIDIITEEELKKVL